MLKQFKFTVDCIVSIHDIKQQDAEQAYRGDPDVSCYLEDQDALRKVVEQQKRLFDAILQHDEVLRCLVRRYCYEYIRERLYDELPKPPEVEEEIFIVMSEAIDALDYVDRVLYLAYAAPRTEFECDGDGDPFEQHTRLIRNSFKVTLSAPVLTESPASESSHKGM